MRPRLIIAAALPAIVRCYDTTKTILQCQTRLGSSSLSIVPSHTATWTVIAPYISMDYTSTPIETVFPTPYSTYTEFETSTTTVTKTLTQPEALPGVWTVTRTEYLYDRTITKQTTIVETQTTERTRTSTMCVGVATPSGFIMANTTSPTPRERIPTIVTSLASTETVYVMRQGVAVPLLPAALGPTSPTDLPTTTIKPAKAAVTSIAPESDHGKTDATTTMTEDSSDSTQTTALAVDTDKSVHRRAAKSSATTSFLRGIRGSFFGDDAMVPNLFPTLVQCTRKVVREHTQYNVHLQPTATIHQNHSTITSTITATMTVRHLAPGGSVTEVSTITTTKPIQTITSIQTITETAKEGFNFTMRSTRTIYHACLTQNQVGPTLVNERRVSNVYDNTTEQFPHFDIGYSDDPEACCVECMQEQGCIGSVFEWNRRTCMLLTGRDQKREVCTAQDPKAAFYTYKYGNFRPPSDVFWPEYVISNGACGIIRQGGPADKSA